MLEAVGKPENLYERVASQLREAISDDIVVESV